LVTFVAVVSPQIERLKGISACLALGVLFYYEDIDEDVEDSMKKTSRNVEVDPDKPVILRSPETQNLLATVIFNQDMLFVREPLIRGHSPAPAYPPTSSGCFIQGGGWRGPEFPFPCTTPYFPPRHVFAGPRLLVSVHCLDRAIQRGFGDLECLTNFQNRVPLVIEIKGNTELLTSEGFGSAASFPSGTSSNKACLRPFFDNVPLKLRKSAKDMENKFPPACCRI
jgi:hypothetical protein